MLKKNLLLCCLLLALVAACNPKGENIEPDDATNVQKIAGNELDPNLMLSLVNRYRREGCTCGNEVRPPVAPLTWNRQLEEAAYLHTKDMRDNSYFSHTSQDGTTFGARITRTGYQHNGTGENIANGQRSEEAVVEAWIKSAGHCRNIMNGNFTELGAARVGNYWTQVFARPR